MKKIILVIFAFFLSFSFISEYKAEIEVKDLKQVLKEEKIEKKFDKLIVNKDQSYIDVFYSSGESKSLEFINFINDIYSQYGDFFNIRAYEVSKNPDNMELMNNMIDYMDAQVQGTPFIIIGETYFTTFKSDVKNNVITAFEENYRVDNNKRVDKVKIVRKQYYRNESLIIGLTLSFIMMLVSGIIYTVVNNKKDN